MHSNNFAAQNHKTITMEDNEGHRFTGLSPCAGPLYRQSAANNRRHWGDTGRLAIMHGEDEYPLRITSKGKLILTK
uniref:Hemin uptake protein hemP n=1 Tax=Candidatus Kentrum eta TaxID=2126337 RepID=A0A450UT64_9GAMM|nr:MAG: Hemin uptake protein hemP [Candidatus Kentron sp. H]VFJ89115.1 MAG: Hemin uptake protein hemP [Candidatus Kentron sp. H]VFJ95803.1 MAG: Hemin uptake protein hemP [Candidatus Kentron sp. H]